MRRNGHEIELARRIEEHVELGPGPFHGGARARRDHDRKNFGRNAGTFFMCSA